MLLSPGLCLGQGLCCQCQSLLVDCLPVRARWPPAEEVVMGHPFIGKHVEASVLPNWRVVLGYTLRPK